MSDSLWQWPLSRFVDATASADPTPGGGSVGAVTASLGLGLVLMGLEITAKGGTRSPLIDEGRALLDRIRAHADRDVSVFGEVMGAYGLPRVTDDEKSARKHSIQRALIVATLAPLASARDVVAALELAQRAASETKKQVLSDTAAGVEILLGSLGAILQNVDINVAALNDRDAAHAYARQREELATQGAEHARNASRVIRER